MGSTQCCTATVQFNKYKILLRIVKIQKETFCNTIELASELATGMKETSHSSKDPNNQSQGKKNKTLSLSPLQKQKGQFRIDDPQTPAFADNKSIHSKQESEQFSNKDIQLVAEIVMQLDDIPQKIEEANEDIFVSQSSLKKKRKNDSPMCDFQPKNSLKSFDSKKLDKLKSISEHFQFNEEIIKKELDSQRSSSADNKSVKSILKQEMKYSQFKKGQSGNDKHSQKKVHFKINK